MNKVKRFCALLLVIVLTLGAALPLGVGGVYAENMGQTEQIVEPITEIDAEPTTEFGAGPTTETEFGSEPTTGSVTEATVTPAAEPTTGPESETEPIEETSVQLFYEQLMACETLIDFDVMIRAEENTAMLEALTQEEWKHLLARVEEIYTRIEQPIEEDTLLKEDLVKLLNEHITVICPECGEENGHAETCSQYVAEPVVYPWAELNDSEFAAWLMDEANAELVKGILSNVDSEEYTSLNSCVEAIRSGADAALAQQVGEYLAALTGTAEPELPELSFYEQLMACETLIDFDVMICAEENTATLEALTQEEWRQLLARVEEIHAGIEQPTEEDTLLKEELVKLLNERIVVICPECGGENGHAETCSQYVAEPAVYPWAEMSDSEFAEWLMDEANAETIKGILANVDSEEYTDLNSRIEVIRGGEDAALIQQIDEYLAALGIGEPELPELSFYEQLMACVSLADFEAVMCAEENTAATLTREELKQILEHVEEIYVSIAQPTEADSLLKEELLKKLNEIPIICPVCEVIDGHAEGCPQYMAELVEYWAELTDQELVEWLMDEANAETVKTILESEGEENAALKLRIEEILSGEDTELAMQLQEYLSVLMGMDEANVLEGDPSYIYFDLAAGNVNIGPKGYSGKVYVNGVAMPVTGTHSPDNKYYVYQSTEANKAGTGYEKEEDYTKRTNCRIPVYVRVSYDNRPWTDYVTNNTDVKGVSNAWETAAKTSGRTSTENTITFESASNYTSKVTIDNIWSSFHEKNESRQSGGIKAHLGTYTNTTIGLQLKGDNRFGNIHYYSKRGTRNQIIFSNGEEGSIPGSITVADFPKNDKANHWCSAIGGNDNSYDPSDGIVINSGVIYAGTTREDNCTAIGGGGNEYGRVTITGGIVTAVTGSTGTAIGGGIGWGSRGGDADITISGGIVYAYNLGIGKETIDGYSRYVPAAAIGGGSAESNTGNLSTNVTITGGTVYAESLGGAAIGGGGSAKKEGGGAIIKISGGTIIAKSTKGIYNKNGSIDIPAGVSIGGGTGKTGGGSVTLEISDGTLRTGSIGGGKALDSGSNIGSAKVKITGGDITGQVVMAGGPGAQCNFDMSGGRIHSTDVVNGNKITDIYDPKENTPILYLEQNGGAVCMDDPIGITNISGGIIENCTAKLGGAIYMTGGTFNLSDTGILKENIARRVDDSTLQGYGGGIYINNGDVEITGGSILENAAQVRGGGIYVNGGKVTVSGGSINENNAGFGTQEIPVPTDVGRGGGVYLEGGNFTMTDGVISSNHANYRGGGIFLTKKPTLTKGVISGNTAVDSGGGLCVNGDAVELKSPNMKIFGNNADNGGGVAVLNGDFILSGGAVGVEGGTKENGRANTATNGGGVYVKAEAGSSTTGTAKANVMVKSGNIWYNEAVKGGGIYLAEGEGDFMLDGESAIVSHNTATNGGGIYLYKDPLMKQGKIEQNIATENGGGMYISDCVVNLNPTGDVFITGNTAENHGAGIYIYGSAGSTVGAIDAVSSASPTNKVGLYVGSTPYDGTLIFRNNIATVSGGAVCVDAGRFVLDSDRITVAGNHAQNGGGVAVLHGNFTMSNGSIGEKNGANTAANGGGVYVSNGEVWLKGGSVQYNEATVVEGVGGNGGGAYVTGGNFIMISGALTNNVAKVNGGGAYVAGNFDMLGGTVGGAGGTNLAEQNGGGVYVDDGNVTVVYGEISYNHAKEDGGGFCVSSKSKVSTGAGEPAAAVDVVMLSGSLSSNQAEANGGGMAVESAEGQAVSVEIGCLRDHNLQNGSPTYPVKYEEAYSSYENYRGVVNEHKSCPEVKGNQAGAIGGGFYMNSEDSTLSFYCVEETGNTAAKGKENSEGMDVEGGKVIIGDKNYHNHDHDQGPEGKKQNVPWGYISMDNATLVNGGQVDIYGDMTNPVFRDEVTVDIEDKDKDHFMDHRRALKNEKNYKVHYIENFFGTGLYQAFQYDKDNTVITIEGALYSHPGYEILGWYTKDEYDPTADDKDNKFYPVGEKFDLSKPEDVPQMGTHSINCTICGENKLDDNLLELYAIWEANGYTVVFDPNVPDGKTYTGEMEDQVHYYGAEQALTKNAYQYPGHFFESWNTKSDGTGNEYEDGEKVSNLTDKNGVKIVLYARWEPCDHTVPE